jgi:hypothetical protein
VGLGSGGCRLLFLRIKSVYEGKSATRGSYVWAVDCRNPMIGGQKLLCRDLNVVNDRMIEFRPINFKN